MQERWVRSLGGKDPLEEEMATLSSSLAGKTPWAEKPGGLQSTGLQRIGHDCVAEHASTDARRVRTQQVIDTEAVVSTQPLPSKSAFL